MSNRKLKINFIIKLSIILAIIFVIIVPKTYALAINNSTLTVKGCVWKDSNGDGKVDDGEEKISGIEVELCDKNGNEIRTNGSVVTAISDINGMYEITVSNISEYKVKIKSNDINKIYKTTFQIIGGNTSNTNMKLAYAYPEGSVDIVEKISELVNSDFRSNYKYEYNGDRVNGRQEVTKKPEVMSELLNKSFLDLQDLIFVAIINNNITGSYPALYSGHSLGQENSQKKLIIVITHDLRDEERQKIYQQYGDGVDEKEKALAIIEEVEGEDYTEKVRDIIFAEKGINANIKIDEMAKEQVQDGWITRDYLNEQVDSINIAVNENLQQPNIPVNAGENNNWEGNDTGSSTIQDDVYDDPLTIEDETQLYIRGKILDNAGNNLDGGMIGVQLVDSSGNVVDKVLTEKGEYSFEMPAAGDYKVKFIYGAGKYNSPDYKVVIPKNDIDDSSYINNVEEKQRYADTINYDVKRKFENLKNTSIGDWKNKYNDSEYEPYFCIAESDEFTIDGTETRGKQISMELEKMPDLNIDVVKNLKAAKITLSDGSVLREERFADKNPADPLDPNSVPAYWYIDDEIMLGATIQLEYEIKVTSSEIAEIGIIDYLSYANSTLMYDAEGISLTDGSTKNGDHWMSVIPNDFRNDLNPAISLEDGKIYLYNGFIGTNNTIKLTVSKLVTPNDENLTYDNEVEVIHYKTDDGRVDWGAAPGDYNPGNKVKEKDNDYSREFIITKPTGGEMKAYGKLSYIFNRMK